MTELWLYLELLALISHPEATEKSFHYSHPHPPGLSQLAVCAGWAWPCADPASEQDPSSFPLLPGELHACKVRMFAASRFWGVSPHPCCCWATLPHSTLRGSPWSFEARQLRYSGSRLEFTFPASSEGTRDLTIKFAFFWRECGQRTAISHHSPHVLLSAPLNSFPLSLHGILK